MSEVKLTCSKCKREIPGEDVNVAKDVAYCRSCNVSYELSALTRREVDADLDLDHPPAGAWRRNRGGETTIGATNRSVATALGTLVFGLFWNGIVSVFVLFNGAATLRHLGVTLPHWFPAPRVDNSSSMGVGMILFLWLFLTPFIAIGLAMVGAFLSAVAGRTEVQISNARGVVFNGVGALGFRRRFDAREVKDVRIEESQWRNNNAPRQCIMVETRQGKEIKFGTMLTPERRKFVAAALRRTLAL